MTTRRLWIPICLALCFGCGDGDSVAGGAGGMASGGNGGSGGAVSNTIVDIVVAGADFSTLETAVLAADLAGTLSGPGPFTVFAPTDAAFAALPDGLLDSLLADVPSLTAVLTYHVVADELLAADVLASTTLTTVQGEDIAVDGTAVTLNGTVNIDMTDVIADNGVVHIIDAVLVPPSFSAQ